MLNKLGPAQGFLSILHCHCYLLMRQTLAFWKAPRYILPTDNSSPSLLTVVLD